MNWAIRRSVKSGGQLLFHLISLGEYALLVLCLDVDRPIAANLAAEETLFIRALGVG